MNLVEIIRFELKKKLFPSLFIRHQQSTCHHLDREIWNNNEINNTNQTKNILMIVDIVKIINA